MGKSLIKSLIPILTVGNNTLKLISKDILLNGKIFFPEDLYLIQKLKANCMKRQGFGMASPQIGESKRVFIMVRDPELKETEYDIFVNPKIIHKSKETCFDVESCFSVPDYFGIVNLKIK
jgi:peptide deformylase